MTKETDKQSDLEKLVGRSQDLTAREQAQGGPDAIIGRLRSQGRFLKLVTVLVFLCVLLTGTAGYGLWRIQSNTNSIRHNTVTSKDNCRAQNDSEFRDHLLYLYVKPLPNPPGLTLAEETQRDKDDALLNTLLGDGFKLRKC